MRKQNDETMHMSRRTCIKGAATVAAVIGGATGCALSPSVKDHGVTGSARSHQSASSSIVASDSNAIAETTAGKVRGYTHSGIFTFKGIPYAGSTAGSARFMSPTKPTPWTGVRSTMAYGYICPQPAITYLDWTLDEMAWLLQPELVGLQDEDCLRLNIWTPAVNDNRKRPVMVWFHGGGFFAGSGHELPAYNGENLSRRGDVVVVTVNNRLGILGYLNLIEYGKKYADSANVGMLDLVAALEWVRDNISNFGGDPGNVTIFGQSGGASRVGAMMTMPAAQGLYHKAIMETGGITVSSAESTAKVAAAVIAELGLTASQIDQIQMLPVQTLINAGIAAVNKLSPTMRLPGKGSGWAPSVDGNILPAFPFDPVAPTISAHIPLLTGVEMHGGTALRNAGRPENESLTYEELKTRVATRYGDNDGRVVDAFSRAHPKAKPAVLWELINTSRTDYIRRAERKAALNAAPVYLYWFCWQSPVLDGRLRSFHSLEIPFVFDNTDLCANMTGGGQEARELAAKISNAWINFARHGDPNHSELAKWPPFTAARGETMIFDRRCETKNDPDREERQVLESVTASAGVQIEAPILDRPWSTK